MNSILTDLTIRNDMVVVVQDLNCYNNYLLNTTAALHPPKPEAVFRK